MSFPDHQAQTPVTLDEWEDLADLRPRWAALAAVTTLAGFSDSYWADDEGWHHHDGGNVIHVRPLPHGRALTYGSDLEPVDPAAPLDVLAGAPEWVRDLLDPLPRDCGIEHLGFAYWLADGTWSRVAYPGDPDDPPRDGASVVGRFMFDDDRAALEVLDWATQWVLDAAGVEWAGDEQELVAAAHTLIGDLQDPGDERQAVDGFLDVLAPSGVSCDIDAAAEAAAQFHPRT